MATCQIKNCNNEAGINPKTGFPNIVCRKHFLAMKNNETGTGRSLPKTQSSKITGPKRKPKDKFKGIPKVELFVLRGHTLTINYTGKTKHINVDRLTRAVKYNDDKEGSSGKTFHYVIDIKQGIETLTNVLFDSKAERDREFAKLQALLSTL
jgi:hypothetical protein